MRKRNCLYCGEPITKKRAGTRFCSRNCNNKFYWAEKVKPKIITANCPACGTKFIVARGKRYCSAECRIQNFTNKIKADVIAVNSKFVQLSNFKAIEATDTDTKDFIFRDLFEQFYKANGLKNIMLKRGINPRQQKTERRTIRGTFRLKVSIVNASELLELYNILIEEFKEKPSMPKKALIEDVGKLIGKIRKIGAGEASE